MMKKRFNYIVSKKQQQYKSKHSANTNNQAFTQHLDNKGTATVSLASVFPPRTSYHILNGAFLVLVRSPKSTLGNFCHKGWLHRSENNENNLRTTCDRGSTRGFPQSTRRPHKCPSCQGILFLPQQLSFRTIQFFCSFSD